MADLTICGFTIPVERGGFEESTDLAGGGGRAISGQPAGGLLYEGENFRISTRLVGRPQARAIADLCRRANGHRWSVDNSEYSAAGLKTTDTLTFSGSVAKFGTHSTTVLPTGAPGAAPKDIATLGTKYTVAAWVSEDAGSTWQHQILRSDGAKWVDGVRNDGASLAFSVASSVWTLDTGGSTRYFDDLVWLRFDIYADWGTQWPTDRAFSDLPELEFRGDLIDGLTADGYASANLTHEGYALIDGSSQDAARVSLEVDAEPRSSTAAALSASTLDQASYRWRKNDGSESAANWLAAVNTSATIYSGTVWRLRFLVQAGAGAATSKAMQLQYRLNAGAWTNVTTSSSVVKAVDSHQLTDESNTTQQLGAGTFISSNSGVSEDGLTPSVSFSGSDEVEVEFALELVTGGYSDGDTLDFRIEGLDTYTNTATSTILFSPKDIFGADLHHWHDFGDTATNFTDTAGTTHVQSGGDGIKRSNDKSGNGYYVEESTDPPAFQPTGGPYSKPGAVYDGTNDKLTTPASGYGSVSEYHIFTVFEDDGTIGVLTTSANNSPYQIVNSNTAASQTPGKIRLFAGAADEASMVAASTAQVGEFRQSSAADEYRDDNDTAESVTCGDNPTGTRFYYGGSTTGALPYGGSIGECFLVDKATITSGERTQIYAYLNHRWS